MREAGVELVVEGLAEADAALLLLLLLLLLLRGRGGVGVGLSGAFRCGELERVGAVVRHGGAGAPLGPSSRRLALLLVAGLPRASLA